jgi:hypothetical protein
MSRIVVISGTEGERRIDYSVLTPKEIEKKLRAYQRQHGSFRKFLHAYDCESSPPEDYVTLIDWESLLVEQKARKRHTERPATSARKKQSKTR